MQGDKSAKQAINKLGATAGLFSKIWVAEGVLKGQGLNGWVNSLAQHQQDLTIFSEFPDVEKLVELSNNFQNAATSLGSPDVVKDLYHGFQEAVADIAEENGISMSPSPRMGEGCAYNPHLQESLGRTEVIGIGGDKIHEVRRYAFHNSSKKEDVYQYGKVELYAVEPE